MTPQQLLNNAYAQGITAERARWRPLFQMLHSLEPELRIVRTETVDKAARAKDANQHDLILKLLEMAPAWPAEDVLESEPADGSSGDGRDLGSAAVPAQ